MADTSLTDKKKHTSKLQVKLQMKLQLKLTTDEITNTNYSYKLQL